MKKIVLAGSYNYYDGYFEETPTKLVIGPGEGNAIFGTPFDDVFILTGADGFPDGRPPGPNFIAGWMGDDRITVKGNVDATLYGGPGDDMIDARQSSGFTTMNGGTGADTMKGGSGRNEFIAGPGDKIVAGTGQDVIRFEAPTGSPFSGEPLIGKIEVHGFDRQVDYLDLTGLGLTLDDLSAKGNTLFVDDGASIHLEITGVGRLLTAYDPITSHLLIEF